MKKILTLLTLLFVLILPIVSCSSDDEAAKQAQTDKGSLIIPDDEDTTPVQQNQLALYVSANSVPVGTLVSFTTTLNGEDVTNQVSYFVNNIAIGGSSIASANNGTFQIQAKLDGYIDSEIKTVIFGDGTNPNPNPEPNPNGNFIYNGTSYNATVSILVLNGAFLDEGSTTSAKTHWTSIVVNNSDIQSATLGAFIDFRTPFNITEGNSGNIVLPNGTNEVYTGISQLLVDNVLTEDIVGTGNIHYTANFSLENQTNAFTSVVNFNGNNLQINYNGAFSFVDDSPEGRPSNSHKASKLNDLQKSKFKSLKAKK